MNKRTFYKERQINDRSFVFLSKQNIIVPLILDINDAAESDEDTDSKWEEEKEDWFVINNWKNDNKKNRP